MPSRVSSTLSTYASASVTGSSRPVIRPVTESKGEAHRRSDILVVVNARRRPSSDSAKSRLPVIARGDTLCRKHAHCRGVDGEPAHRVDILVVAVHEKHRRGCPPKRIPFPNSVVPFSRTAGSPDSGTVYTPIPWPWFSSPSTETRLASGYQFQSRMMPSPVRNVCSTGSGCLPSSRTCTARWGARPGRDRWRRTGLASHPAPTAVARRTRSAVARLPRPPARRTGRRPRDRSGTRSCCRSATTLAAGRGPGTS